MLINEKGLLKKQPLFYAPLIIVSGLQANHCVIS